MSVIPLNLQNEYRIVVDAFNLVSGMKFKVMPFDFGRHKKYINNFLLVTKFLVEFKGDRKKSLNIMAKDYFIALKYAHVRLHGGGFRLAQIDSEYSKETFKRFVTKRSYYFEDSWAAKTERLLRNAKSDFERAKTI